MNIPDTKAESRQLTIELRVDYVKTGGNTRNGEYFYSFDPDLVLVRKPRTPLVFVMGAEVPPSFRIVDLVTSDSRFQIGSPVLAENGRSVRVMNENTQRELMHVALLVQDEVRDTLIVCDPQVINSPESTN